MKKAIVLHPFLFAIFAVLFLFSHNIEQVSFSDILLSLAIVLGFVLLLVLSLRLMLRHSQKSGIIVSLFLVLFFSYGQVYNIIEGKQIGIFLIGRHRYLMPLWGMLFICGIYFAIRILRDLHNFTNIMNTMAFSLVLISLINIGIYEFKTRGARQYNGGSAKSTETNIVDLGNQTQIRDIYYIILDGYASSNTLKEIYDYDNCEFTDYLMERGFYIASKSRSNYAYTEQSLASSLNIEYLNHPNCKTKPKNAKVLYQMIKSNKVMNFLKSRGYKFIHFGSGWGATNHNKYADLDFRYGRIDEFLMCMIHTTMLKPFVKPFIVYDARKRVLCTFSKLAEIHRIKGPKFVFAHILCPHPPYLFGANGETVLQARVMSDPGMGWKFKENYLNQLIFITKKVKTLIDEILSKSEVSPIIILQADHGPASVASQLHSSGWNRPTENMLRERMRIFNAYYLPASGNDFLYSSITPVNTFRIIFNFYFDTNYELLSDESYLSILEHPYNKFIEHPYNKFIDVTDRVKYE